MGLHSLSVLRIFGSSKNLVRGKLRPNHSAKVVSIAFAITILVGGLLLMLPIARTGAPAWPTTGGLPGGPYPEAGLRFGDGAPASVAFFTATSATCVTGLVVVDTATYWTTFGKVVIISLIQIGGIGTMTLASLLGMFVLRRLELRHRVTLAETVGQINLADVRGVVFMVLKIAITVEVAIALILTGRFYFGYNQPLGKALANGFFHSVSAFNNAGFALYTDSLISFAQDPWILVSIAIGIIVGGIGFPVIIELWRHRGPRISMTAHLVVAGTVVLIMSGWILITMIEWNNPYTLGKYGVGGKILGGFFASVTARTAGFDAINVGGMHSTSLLVTDMLMFVGGGPAGTAGGVKITTIGVIVALMIAEMSGLRAVNIMGARLARSTHRQAITVVAMAMCLITGTTMFVMVQTPYSLDPALFEVISAFATVGLSTGITPGLPVQVQVLLMALMFIGRVGPLTLAVALALRARPPQWEYAKERPLIG